MSSESIRPSDIGRGAWDRDIRRGGGGGGGVCIASAMWNQLTEDDVLLNNRKDEVKLISL